MYDGRFQKSLFFSAYNKSGANERQAVQDSVTSGKKFGYMTN